MAVTFITPTEDTPGSADAWTDVDNVSVPDGASGVILHVVNTSTTTSHEIGLRKNGSTDNRINTLGTSGHFWAAIGVDGSGIFEAYVGDTTDIDIYIVGYFGSEATFLTNATNHSTGTAGSWQDVDISGDTGTTAIGAIFETVNGQIKRMQLRVNGSSDTYADATTVVDKHCWFVVGVDGNEICEQRVDSTNSDLYLVGYITADATFHTDRIARTRSASSSWDDITALPAGAIGGIYTLAAGGGDSVGMRKNGSSENITYQATSYSTGGAFIECDGSQLIEAYTTDHTNNKFYEVGYFESAAGGLTVTTTLDAVVKKQNLTVSTTLDAALQEAKSLSVTLDGILQKANTKTSTLDAVLLKEAQTVATTLDAALRKTQSITSTLDAVLQTSGSVTTTFDAKLIDSGTFVLTTLDAIIQKAQTKTVTLDAIIQTSATITSTLDAIILIQSTVTATLDAILQKAQSLATTMDAYLYSVGWDDVSLGSGSWSDVSAGAGSWSDVSLPTADNWS